MTKEWKCRVCGFLHKGSSPPIECPQCSSSSAEFVENKPYEKLRYDGRRFDVLLINGSSHKGHNTSILADFAEEALKKKGLSCGRFNLNELFIQHCWCCYSMYDSACTYPCRDQLDDMPALHEMLVDCKAVIIASPINWNNMSARLKDFLDRLTCIQNIPLVKNETIVAGKIFGVLINGHEDGALKTALDIFTYFEQMGFIMAPFGFAYRTHGGSFNAKEDNKFFLQDKKIKKDVEGVVNNITEMIKLDLENKLKGKLALNCE
jgi:multimeric flavodoxin WrbA